MVDVVDRLCVQAARIPDAPAVVAHGRTMTYAAFLDRAAAFARRLEGIEWPRVLIAMEKGADAYAAMFGTLMAGGVYAPVNIASPLARLAHIRDLFEPDLIVAVEPLASRLGTGERPPFSRRRDKGGAEPPAYVIFTSGSTGAPKGVAVSRAALAHYVDWLGPALEIGPDDRMSQHPTIGFDLSVLDIFGALCHGAALHPFVETSARLLPARKIRDEAITIWNSVPSVVTAMETAGELDAVHLASVRLFSFCGEVLQRAQVAKLFAARPDAVILNTYGPTEATVAMTCRRLTAATFDAVCDPSAPLGDPIGGMWLDLVGGAGQGEGEIVISGPQLADRYWGDAALTAAKFRELATPAGPVRAFYTGDYARRVGAETYFLGRADDMVKLHGHRIHLGEISRVLAALGWPCSCVVEADGALHAFVEGAEDAFNASALRAAIADRLDAYFVPATIRCLERLPRTGNDKVDTATLRAAIKTS